MAQCALCAKSKDLEWLNLNELQEYEPEISRRVGEMLQATIGDHAVVVVCKFCIAEVRLST